MTSVAPANAADPYAKFNGNAASSAAAKTDETADRFLKLLVTQMQNQDPLNPMDNAQVTTQMAQINTVNGIQQVNNSIKGLTGQFLQMQALQSATLVGRDVSVKGNQLAMADGLGRGAVALDSAATSLQVEIRSATGTLVDMVNLGPRAAGTTNFTWDPARATPPVTNTTGLTFRAVAANGNTALPAQTLMRDRVDSVRTTGDTLTLDLRRTGPVPYADVKALN